MLQNRINRVRVRNFRSLADVTVDLADLTVLVGENGSGKSNFFDILPFVRDGLRLGLSSAIQKRSNIRTALLHHVYGHEIPADIEIEIDISLTINQRKGHYGFILSFGERPDSYFSVKSEVCLFGDYGYEIVNGAVVHSSFLQSLIVQDRNLALPLIAGIPELAPVYDFLTQMRFYSINPKDLRFTSIDRDQLLREDGGNLHDAVYNLNEYGKENLNEVLAMIVPGISKENPIGFEFYGENNFVLKIKHEKGIFSLEHESDGTIRVLALFTALLQTPTPSLIGIEEPELMIHPHALAVLCDNLWEASHRGQIILTTHSPDLIARLPAESLRVVEMVDGETKIDPIREDQLEVINDKLFNGGDLLRIEGLKRG